MSANAQNSPIQPPNYHQHPHHYQHNHPTYQTIPQVVSVVPQVILVGGCPCCRVGVLEDDYSCLGICCAILCFPLGILCCLATKQRRCSNCGAVYGWKVFIIVFFFCFQNDFYSIIWTFLWSDQVQRANKLLFWIRPIVFRRHSK